MERPDIASEVRPGRDRRFVAGLLAGCAAALLALEGAGVVVDHALAHPGDDEERLAAQHEWESFRAELESQCLSARSQLSSGVARRRDRDPQGALVDLKEAVRILDDLPLLKRDFQRHVPVGRLEEHLASKAPAIAAIYRDVYLELARAHVDQDDLDAALDRLREGLGRGAPSAESVALELEVARVLALQGELEQARAAVAKVLERRPDDDAARLALARVHRQAGELDQAVERCSQLLARAGGSREALLLRGQCLLERGRLDEALADFDEALRRDDSSFEGYVWRGRTRQALGQWGEALEDLTEAIDLNPALPDGYSWRAELYAAQGKHAEAIKDHEVALSRSPTYHRSALGLGRALARVLDDGRARTQYEAVLRAADREARALAPEVHAALGDLLSAQADVIECQLEVEARLRQAGETADAAALRADGERLAAERAKEARAAYDLALKARPDLVPALVGRARLTIATASPDLVAARKDLVAAQAALAGRPGQPLAEVKALQGLVALRQDLLPAAKAAFEAALQASPTCPLAHAGQGHLARAAGDAAAAAASFARAREGASAPGEAQGWYQEGLRQQELHARGGRAEQALRARRCFVHAQLLDPLSGLSLLARARVAAATSSVDAAAALAERAVQVDPTLREALELLGALLVRDLPAERRDPARAEARFGEALALARTPEEEAVARHGRALARRAQAGPSAGAGDARLLAAREDLEAASAALPVELRGVSGARLRQALAALELLAAVDAQLGLVDEEVAARVRLTEIRAAGQEAAREALREGQRLRDRLEYKQAVAAFDRAIELDPDLSAAIYERGTCWLKLGSFVPGILDFSRALELDPRISDQVYNKVYQISHVVDLNRVIVELDKLVADRPNASHVVFLRGFFRVARTEFKQVDREDLDRGIADFDRTLELNPRHVTALLYRGLLAFRRLGLLERSDAQAREAWYERAMADYQAALALDPESGISHYLQALWWSVRSTEEQVPDAERVERRRRAVDELRASFERQFKGYERIKAERGFDALKDDPGLQELLRGR